MVTLTLQAAAAAAGDVSYVLPFTSMHRLHAKANGIDYTLYVRVPPDYASNDRRYPVIYMLDADYAFPVAVNIVDLMRRFDQAPQAILVAIGYTGQYPSEEKYRLNRTRDYTPAPMAGASSATQKNSGGAARFLRTIEGQIFPFVENNYRTNPRDRTLVGHSYGGLFAAWVLQQRPELFRRYLLVSPSLWYNGELLLEREEAGPMPRLANRTLVYMAIGSDENFADGAPMIDQLTRFAELLTRRRDPNLVEQHRVFQDETHASIFPIAFSTGVRHLFGEMAGQTAREVAAGSGQ